ncbi:MAG: hypothetical protein ABSG45_00865 [Nitrososphaerales archaeon]
MAITKLEILKAVGTSFFYWITGILFDRVLQSGTGISPSNYGSIVLGVGTAAVGTLVLYDIFRPRSAEKPKAEDAQQSPHELLRGIDLYRTPAERDTKPPLFLSAESHVYILAIDGGMLVMKFYAEILDMCRKGKVFEFLLLDNKSKFLDGVEDCWSFMGDSHTVLATSLETLSNIRKEIPSSSRTNLQVKFYDLLPIHSMTIIDPESDDAEMQVTLHRYDTHNWSFLRISKREQPDLFKSYWDSYRFVEAKSSEWREIASSAQQSLSENKTQLLNALNDGYESLALATKPEAKKFALESIRGQLHRLCFGDIRSIKWDNDVRNSLTRYFTLLSGMVSDAQVAAGSSMGLSYLFRKEDPETIEIMRKVLKEPFDNAYQKATLWDMPECPFVFNTLVGLHAYEASYVNQLIDDVLVGLKPKFVAFARSLDLDLRRDLQVKSDYPKIQKHLVRKVEEYEGNNPEAVTRAKQLAQIS